MQPTTGRVLWSAFGALALLVTLSVTLNLVVLDTQDRQSSLRLGLTLLLIVVSIAVLAAGAYAVIRVDRSLRSSAWSQVNTTEVIIAAAADGTMLSDRASLTIENARLYAEQVEARRKLEDLSRLKDEFLSIASHELRTPVTSIKGYTQLAKRLIHEGDLDTSEEYLEVALDQIDRMSRLILELLDVSRIETGRLEIRREPIRWTSFVRNVVQHHHAAACDRRFNLEVDDDDPVVQGDRDRLEQVLGNLLENAVKYSPDGSEITVKVQTGGEKVVTAICDSGIGIPTDELDLVFERFHRGRQVSSTNYGGLGLGLYISKQIVERHDGSIRVESREGQGTTFYFALPSQEMAGAMSAS